MADINLNNRLKAIINNLTPGKWLALLSLTGGVIAIFIVMLLWASKPDYRPLYTGLAIEDSSEIMDRLKEEKIPCEIKSNGTSIFVPADKIYETRLKLASLGLPKGGLVGFELFDDTKLGMTEFLQNVNYQRALQGELSRTINSFEEVNNSRVHIVMASKSLFMEKSEPATASVVLNLRHGRWLNKDQIQGIVHLVSSSVSGLSPENVVILDNNGKIFAGYNDPSTMGKATSDQLEFRENIDHSIEKRLKTMLDSVLGKNKSIVRVSCLINFKKNEMKEERYYPDNKVIRSEQVASENSKEGATSPTGIPGVRSNVMSQATESAGTKTNIQKQDKTVNYEIGKIVSHIVEPVGTIQKVSVAVVLDGIYKAVKGKKELQYFPRSPEEMDKLKKLVKNAVGFDSKRGDEVQVENIPFAMDKNAADLIPNTETGWMSKLSKFKPILKYMVAGIFFLFIFLYVIKPLVKWTTSVSIGELELLRQLPKTVNEIENEYRQTAGGTYGVPIQNRVSNMIAKNSETSVELMKGWLQER